MLIFAAFSLPDDYKALAIVLVLVVETLREGRNRKIRRKLNEVEARVGGTKPNTRPRRSRKHTRKTKANA